MRVEDVGKFFTTNGKDIWQMISACKEPTAMLRNLQTGEEIDGAIGCLNFQDFVKLIPESKLKERES